VVALVNGAILLTLIGVFARSMQNPASNPREVIGETIRNEVRGQFSMEDIDAKIAQLSKPGTTADTVIRSLGEPERYFWGDKTFEKNSLPETYILQYPGGVMAAVDNGRVMELRSEQPGPGFAYRGKLRLGSSLDEVLEVIGQPTETVVGKPMDSATAAGVLYKDIDGTKGISYYARPEQNLRCFFMNDTVTALYITVGKDRGMAGETRKADPEVDWKMDEALLKPLPASLNLPYLCRSPQPANFKNWTGSNDPLTSLPKYNPDNPWFSVDLRSRDASRLDLRDSAQDLEHASYDSQTIWPPKDRMPPAFDAAQVLELGKNPGLGVRKLHAQGITGRGIGIGIVDQVLLTRHSEYAGQIKWYEEIAVSGEQQSAMHGPAVASIAVGKTVGVAPEADLYFIGFGENVRSNFLPRYYAQGVRRLLQVNQRLPKEHGIRAISLSYGPGPGAPGYESFISAIKEAETDGIFVAWCGEGGRFPLWGLCVPPAADRDDFQSYSVSQWLLQRSNQSALGFAGLWVPMDLRTTASPTGVNDYVFYGTGGASWTVPYAAGAYALAAQVAPDITPEHFWSLAVKTGRNVQAKYNGRDVAFGPIIDMAALVKALLEEERTK
jgi:hypothetical protein